MAGPVWHVASTNSALSAGNQTEMSIVVDPSDPDRVFVIAISAPPGGARNGFLGAMTEDGGANWNPMKVAEGPDMDIPQGSSDPWAAFSDEGKLFISYFKDKVVDEELLFDLGPGVASVIVAMWDEGNNRFQFLEALPDNMAINTDKPTMAIGPLDATSGREALWVLYRNGTTGEVKAAGAKLDENGIPELVTCPQTGEQRYFCEQVVASGDPQTFPGFPNAFPGDIAVGPSGEVAVSFIRFDAADTPIEGHVSVDPDGLDPSQGFPPQDPNQRIFGTTLELGPLDLPPQPDRNPFINANLAWDRVGERLYLVTMDEVGDGTNETDIVLFTSTTGGPGSWMGPITVNDDDKNGAPAIPEAIRSQFIPNIAVDQETGLVAVAWQDPRRDDGSGSDDQSDLEENTESEAFFGVTFDVVQGFTQTAAARELSIAPDLEPGIPEFSHLDYLGVAIHDGTAWVAWADNSQSSDDGPNTQDDNCGMATPPDPPNPPCMDLYVTKFVPEPSGPLPTLAGIVSLGLIACVRSSLQRAAPRRPV
jgi:hypothetical protein